MISLYALDSAFNVITVGIPYSNLQWIRRYYESGQFVMEIPLSIYDPTWEYIGAYGRKELGMVQKKYNISGNTESIIIAGFFCEKMLDDKTCYPRYIGDVQKTETAVRNIFARFKDDLPIQLGPANDPLLGDRTQSDFSDDLLGDKLFRILESRECSYRVEYDYLENDLKLYVWQGKDRTQGQQKNAWKVFSYDFGNIGGRNFDIDSSAEKNYAIIPVNADDNGKEQATYYLDWSNGGYRKEIVFDMRAEKPEEGQSEAEFKAGILQEAAEKLTQYMPINDIDADTIGIDDYMVGYDLGDKCSFLLNDIHVDLNARITEVIEVCKADGGHTVTLGIGNKRIKWRAL